MFLNESNILEYSIMNNVFFSTHSQVAVVGAYATIKADAFVDAIEPCDKARFDSFKESDGIIVLSLDVVDALDRSELHAIIEHEQAHLDLGHATAEAGELGFVDCMAYELEADAVAVQRAGAAAMKAVLRKVIKPITKAVMKELDIPQNEYGRLVRGAVRSMKPRIAAIRAAM